jgi:asparagine synthase (glutamine-hydrolysing)
LEELVARGHRFKTGSDMEVVVHGYEAWGDRRGGALSEQFAFALWDQKRARLAARDRAGEKALYHEGPEDIVFASEISPLLAGRRSPKARRRGARSLPDLRVHSGAADRFEE